jgi:hypothetical protein
MNKMASAQMNAHYIQLAFEAPVRTRSNKDRSPNKIFIVLKPLGDQLF